MTDKNRSDAKKSDPLPWLADDTPARKGLPAWLDGFDAPEEGAAPADANTPISLDGPNPASPSDVRVTPTPGGKVDSWPELISVTQPSSWDSFVIPPAAASLPAGPIADPAESASWSDLPLPLENESGDNSEVNLGQVPRQRPDSKSQPVAPSSSTPSATESHVDPPGASNVLEPAPAPPLKASDPSLGLAILKDEFNGLGRLSRGRHTPLREPAGPLQVPEPDPDPPTRRFSAAELRILLPNESPEPPSKDAIPIPVALTPDPTTPDPASLPPVTGPPSSGGMEIESITASQFRRGLTVTYGMAVRNTNPEPLYQLRVEHDLPEGPRFVSADPPPEIRGTTLVWTLGTLEPGEKHRLQITIQPNHAAEIPEDAVALFRMFQCVYSRTRVLKPVLSATLTLPDRAIVGESIPLAIKARNTGAGAAADLVFVIPLPSGLIHEGGAEAVEFTTPRIGAGGTCRFETRLTATRAGNFTLQLQATGAHKLRTAAQATVAVLAPDLHLRLSGPPTVTIGQSFECGIDVTNLGGARATAVQAALILPEGIEYAGEAGAGCFNADGRSLTWAVDALAPNESRRLVAVVVARATGTFDLRADAWDRTGNAVASAKDVSVQSPLDQSAGSDDQDDLVATLDRDVLAATTPPVPSPETRHLLFAVADLDFAVPIGHVLEIARPAATTPLPHLPDWLAGVTMVRGDIVSVVDLGRFLGLPRGVAEPRARLLLVRAGDVQAGLLVDRVAGVHVLPPTTGRLTERIGNDRVRPYLRGVANHNGRPLLILDLDRLFQSPEMRPFEPA